MSCATPSIAFRGLPAGEDFVCSLGDWARRMGEAGDKVIGEVAAGGSRVLLTSEVRAAVCAHLDAQPYECGGLLVGEVYALGDHSPYPFLVSVTHAVADTEAVSGPASLAMSARVWSKTAPWLDLGLKIVGWYHSHPGLGVFFSATDRRTQRSFFCQPYSVGLVVDWQHECSGVYLGAEAHPGRDLLGCQWDPIYGGSGADRALRSTAGEAQGNEIGNHFLAEKPPN